MVGIGLRGKIDGETVGISEATDTQIKQNSV